MKITSRFNRVAAFIMAGIVAAMPLHGAAAENDKIKLSEIDNGEFENFTVRLSGPVSADSALKLNRELRYLDEHNPEKRDITLLINSPGGLVDQGFAILDTLRSMKSDVRTICWAQCASMAAVILTAGGTPGKRFITPNANLMYHQPSAGCGGKVTDMQICIGEAQSLKNRLVGELVTYSGLPREQLFAAMERDWTISAHDAVAFGLADSVMPMRTLAPGAIRPHRIPEDKMNRILRLN